MSCYIRTHGPSIGWWASNGGLYYRVNFSCPCGRLRGGFPMTYRGRSFRLWPFGRCYTLVALFIVFAAAVVGLWW